MSFAARSGRFQELCRRGHLHQGASDGVHPHAESVEDFAKGKDVVFE